MAVCFKVQAKFELVIALLDSPGALEETSLHGRTADYRLFEIPVTKIPDRILTVHF
jgi:hypothetical protein